MAKRKTKPRRPKGAKKAEHVPGHVGEQMRLWREAAGLSQEKVAAAIGCTKSHISQAENGVGNMSVPLFLKFCAAIKAPTSRIFEEWFVAKNKDVARALKEVAKRISASDIFWLAELEKAEVRLAVARAREAVEYDRRKRSERERVDPAAPQAEA